MSDRRLKRVEVAVPLMVRALTSEPVERISWYRPQNPLPADAVFLWCYVEPDGRSVSFVFEHESFMEVPEGYPIPAETIIYESRIFTEVSA